MLSCSLSPVKARKLEKSEMQLFAEMVVTLYMYKKKDNSNDFC